MRDGPLTLYGRDLRAIPPLTPGEEASLVLAAGSGAPAARARLIEAHLGLVVTIARDFRGCGLDPGDLVGAGNVGLILAVDDFEPDRGVPFARYARRRIRWSIIEAIVRTAGLIRVPDYLGKGLARAPSAGSGRRSDLPARALRARRLAAHGADPEDEADPLEAVPDVRDAPDVAAERAEASRELQRRLDLIGREQRTIMTWRYGLDGGKPLTQVEIGLRLGVTGDWVRRLERRALRGLAGKLPVAPPSALRPPGHRPSAPGAAPEPGLLPGWVLDPDEGR